MKGSVERQNKKLDGRPSEQNIKYNQVKSSG